MNNEILVLCVTAAGIGFFHTILGPDHYLPFIMMARARGWSIGKTSLITFLCGLGHVMSSVVIGLAGVVLGIALFKLEALESARGSLAAWALIAFGFVYFVWGLRQAVKNRPHVHLHIHESEVHAHPHSHSNEHAHAHADEKRNITPWILFTIFVFGPCEPLIPILMYPAAKHSVYGTVIVASIFSLVTISTMMGIVFLSSWGISFARFGKMERYVHALAGGTICISGLAIQFLGL